MAEGETPSYSGGDVVWVKLGPCWWPGEVCAPDELPPGILKSFRKPPIAVVRFFQEKSFEYVKNAALIHRYQCSKKRDFIKKGLELFRSKRPNMEKFPGDVSTAEERTGGDPNIIEEDEFRPQKKESYANIFGSPEDSAASTSRKLGSSKRGRASGHITKRKMKSANSPFSPKITHPRILQKQLQGTSDYKAHILVQPNEVKPPSDSLNESHREESSFVSTPDMPSSSKSGSDVYACNSCNFSTNRLNILVMHNKSHSSGCSSSSPVKRPRSPPSKTKSRSVTLSDADDDYTPKSSGRVKKLRVKSEKKQRGKSKSGAPSPSKSPTKEPSAPLKRKYTKPKDKESKKIKSDIEIKKSLLADWNEDSDESMDILTSLKLAENQNASCSRLSETPAQSKNEPEKNEPPSEPKNDSAEKRGLASCFDFDEDEDLEIEQMSRKIPRLTKPEESKKINDTGVVVGETKSECTFESAKENADSVETDVKTQKEIAEFDSAVNDLLKETSVPNLPALPGDSNFQKSNVVKVPDKEKPTENVAPVKSIFKTKTFFRSRHSRSQDAIEKYVADNASTDKPPTYMEEPVEIEKSNDLSSDANDGSNSEARTVSPEDVALEPKTEHVRVAKFAPKIQLKKMTAALVNKNKTAEEKNEIMKMVTGLDDNPSLENILESGVGNIENVPEGKVSGRVTRSSNQKIENEPKHEKKLSSENINAAKSLVEMSKMVQGSQSDQVLKKQTVVSANVEESASIPKITLTLGDETKKTAVSSNNTFIGSESKIDPPVQKPMPGSPKVSKPIEELSAKTSPLKILSTKVIKPQGKEKILNFNVGPQPKMGSPTPTQKIIIRRSIKSDEHGELLSENLIMNNKSGRDWNEDNVQTFTIEGSTGEDLLEPKLKKVIVNKPGFHSKAHNTIITSTGEIIQSCDLKRNEALFDINSMPIVLSDEIIENVDVPSPSATKPTVLNEKSSPVKKPSENAAKKSIIVKSVSPNILSKSGKAKTKHIIFIDKNTGEKKILLGQSDDISEKVLQTADSLIQSKERVLLNTKLPLAKKPQRIILTPTTDNNVVISETKDTTSSHTVKPKLTATKIIQGKAETAPGNRIMIITNSQGVQSKVLLTPENQKLLFPKGKFTPVTQITAGSKLSHSSTAPGKVKVTQSGIIQSADVSGGSSAAKGQLISSSKVISKPKTTILNSKGQIILPGSGSKRTILTTMPGHAILTSKGQLIAPQSSIITSSNKLLGSSVKQNILLSSSNQSRPVTKIIQTQKISQKHKQETTRNITGSTVILKSNTDDSTVDSPAQKTGTTMHYLTAAQFEHFQKTGQIISTPPSKLAGKVVQKCIIEKVIAPKNTFESEIQNNTSQVQKRKGNVFSSEVSSLTSIQSNVAKNYDSQVATATTDVGLLNKINNSERSNNCTSLDSLLSASIKPPKKREDVSTAKDAAVSNKGTPTDGPSHEAQFAGSAEKTETNVAQTDQNLQTASALQDAQKQLLAVPGESFGGPPNSFFLCVEENGALTPVDNQPLILENNQLVPMTITSTVPTTPQTESSQAVLTDGGDLTKTTQSTPETQQTSNAPIDPSQQHILINIGDQQLLVDHQTLLSLVAGDGQHLVTNDGQHLVFQGNSQQILAALASNPELASLLSSGQQLLLNTSVAEEQPAVSAENQSSENYHFQPSIQPNVNQDILAAALAGTEVFQQDSLINESINIVTTGTDSMLMDIDSLSPNLQNLSSGSVVHSSVFETSSTMNQPIMSPLEIPTKKDQKPPKGDLLAMANNSQSPSKNLDDSLAGIGVSSASVPTSLELPITVTNPRIAVKTTSPLSLSCSNIYQSSGTLTSTISPGSIGLYDSDGTVTGLSSSLEAVNTIESQSNKNTLTKSQPLQASSMPSLDDLSSESGIEEKGPSSEVSHSKAYTPISMPILIDDAVDAPPAADITVPNNDSDSASNHIFSDKDESQESLPLISSETTDAKSMPMLTEPYEEFTRITGTENVVKIQDTFQSQDTSSQESQDIFQSEDADDYNEFPRSELNMVPENVNNAESTVGENFNNTDLDSKKDTKIEINESTAAEDCHEKIESADVLTSECSNTETDTISASEQPNIGSETVTASEDLEKEIEDVSISEHLKIDAEIVSTSDDLNAKLEDLPASESSNMEADITPASDQPNMETEHVFISECVDNVHTLEEIMEPEHTVQVAEIEDVPMSENSNMTTDEVSTSDIFPADNSSIDAEIKYIDDNIETFESVPNTEEKPEESATHPEEGPNFDVPHDELLENNIDSNEIPDDGEICAATPPHVTEQDSSMPYDDEEEEQIVQHEAHGNSLPDHIVDELNVSCSSESAALPDSTSPNVEMAPTTTTPDRRSDNVMFSGESSDDSSEIPIQPTIAVSQHMVQNFSSILNNQRPTAEDAVTSNDDHENDNSNDYDER